MKLALVMLDYLRHTYTEQSVASFNRGNYPFDLFTIDRLGIAAGFNEGIDATKNYDAVAFCGNDIQMPDNWLQVCVEHITAIPDTGFCTIHCVEALPPITIINGKEVHECWGTFGNVVVPRKAIDAVGYFNVAYDPYGMQDSDYAYRLHKMGFKNYYIKGMQSIHLGHDVGDQTEYRKMKDEGLNKSAEVWGKYTALYEQTNDYTILENNLKY